MVKEKLFIDWKLVKTAGRKAKLMQPMSPKGRSEIRADFFSFVDIQNINGKPPEFAETRDWTRDL